MNRIASRRPFTRALNLLMVVALLAGLTLALRPAPVAAANAPIVVAFTLDGHDGAPGDGNCDAANSYVGCTLRAAIMEANAWPGDDTITLPTGTYNLTIGGAGENASKTGDLDILSNLTINGAGAGKTFVDGQALDRVFQIATPGAKVTLSNLTIRNGKELTDDGGGIFNGQGVLTLDQVVVTGNTSDDHGGGIANDLGSITLLGSMVSGNTSGNSGGGIIGEDSNLTLTNSTVSNNTSEIYGGGIASGNSNLTITNSTISGNVSGYFGGGIMLFGGVGKLNNVTIAGNKADSDKDGEDGGGGVAKYMEGQFSFKNTLIADNVNADDGSASDCLGTLYSTGYNLIEQVGSECTVEGDPTGNKIGVDPKLMPLAYNGGPTMTHRLSYNSPTLDNGGYSCATTDQRGVARPLDATADGSARCDIGAYEFTGPWITSLSPKAREAGSSGFTLTLTGVRFTAKSIVRWNGVDHVPTSWSPTKLTVKITAGEIKKPGKVQVQVFTPTKGAGLSNPRIFTITAP